MAAATVKFMIDDDPREISNLVSTQYVELTEIVQRFSKTLSITQEEARDTLNGHGLPLLRPITVQSGSDWDVVVDSSDKKLIDSIIHQLGGLPFSELSEETKYYTSHCEFHWDIPTLFQWCNRRKLNIPQDWGDWMNTSYHELHERGLVEDMHDTPTSTSSRQTSRKRRTQARNSGLNYEYNKLKKENPDKSDTWISKQIAKMPIAEGLQSETIRKNMKNEIKLGEYIGPNRPA